jgi:hypothetical protein
MPAFVLSLLALACVAVLMVAAPKPARSAFGAGSDCWQGGGSWVSVPPVSLRIVPTIIDLAITDRITDPTIATGMATPITIGAITVGPASACGLATEPSSQFLHLSWLGGVRDGPGRLHALSPAHHGRRVY